MAKPNSASGSSGCMMRTNLPLDTMAMRSHSERSSTSSELARLPIDLHQIFEH